MALASIGAPAPTPCADEPASIQLHTLYHSNLACNFNNDLTLRAHQAQSITGSLRGIQAITAVLIATADEDAIDLGPWMRSGLIEAINTITWAMSADLEKINERATNAQGAQQ